MAVYENMMGEIQEKLLGLALLQNLPIFLSFRIQHKMNIIKENKDDLNTRTAITWQVSNNLDGH